jgi:hypothetical protein
MFPILLTFSPTEENNIFVQSTFVTRLGLLRISPYLVVNWFVISIASTRFLLSYQNPFWMPVMWCQVADRGGRS